MPFFPYHLVSVASKADTYNLGGSSGKSDEDGAYVIFAYLSRNASPCLQAKRLILEGLDVSYVQDVYWRQAVSFGLPEERY